MCKEVFNDSQGRILSETDIFREEVEALRATILPLEAVFIAKVHSMDQRSAQTVGGMTSVIGRSKINEKAIKV